MASNYSFMKSGFNNLQEEALGEEEINNLNALVYAFMEKAIISADKYVQHSGRDTITKQDIKLVLKAETFKFLQRDNIMESIGKWQEILAEDDDSEDEEELSSIINNAEYVEFKKSMCACKNCTFFNGIEEKWEKWVPNSQMEQILKNAVLRID